MKLVCGSFNSTLEFPDIPGLLTQCERENVKIIHTNIPVGTKLLTNLGIRTMSAEHLE